MAGLKGKSGPPGNMNAFKHVAAIQKRREEGVPTERDENVRKSNPGRIDSRPATRYQVMLCGADIMKTFGKRHTPGWRSVNQDNIE